VAGARFAAPFTSFARHSPVTVLATRCPNCLTVFRLAPDQLSVRGGRVRCGHCHTIFDGKRNKTDLPLEADAPVQARVSPEDARRSMLARLSARAEPALQGLEPPLRPHPDRRQPAPPAAFAYREESHPAAAPPAPSREPRRERRSGGIGRSLFAVLFVFLLLGAALQYAWWQRENLRVIWPPSEVAYQAVCRVTGCKLVPVHDIDLLQIASMSLRQIDDPHHLALALTIRNRAGLTLAYPAIELTLTDNNNQAAIRKVIAPAQYLSDPAQQDSGIAPREEQTLQIRVDTATVPASNYRVKIFYP